MVEDMLRQLVVSHDKAIGYSLKYHKRKNRQSISMSIDIFGHLIVSVHPSVKEHQVNQVLLKHLDWIDKHITKKKFLLGNKGPIHYQEGAVFYYLGEPYRLKLLDSSSFSIAIKEGNLCVFGYLQFSEQYLMKRIDTWYRIQALSYFQERLQQLLPVTPWVKNNPILKVRKMKRQWGSCSSNGKVTLNIHLIKLPPHLIDYVILHELCHFQEYNHSDKFYELLKGVVSEWKLFKKEIKHYVYHLYELNEK